jgi:hypothetical protein
MHGRQFDSLDSTVDRLEQDSFHHAAIYTVGTLD